MDNGGTSLLWRRFIETVEYEILLQTTRKECQLQNEAGLLSRG